MHLPEPIYEALPELYVVAAVATAYLLPQAVVSVFLLVLSAGIILNWRREDRRKRAIRHIQTLERKLEFIQAHGSDRWPA